MTQQQPEILIYQGSKGAMGFFPDMPNSHPRLHEREEDEYIVGDTSCWRGYVGTWEIRDDRFYLVAISGKYEMVGDDPIFADWVRGSIVFGEGEELEDPNSFEPIHEKETVITIEEGLVVKIEINRYTQELLNADTIELLSLDGESLISLDEE